MALSTLDEGLSSRNDEEDCARTRFGAGLEAENGNGIRATNGSDGKTGIGML